MVPKYSDKIVKITSNVFQNVHREFHFTSKCKLFSENCVEKFISSRCNTINYKHHFSFYLILYILSHHEQLFTLEAIESR